jgi:hypothetical protein
MTDDTKPPFKALSPMMAFQYAIGIAMREAEIDGLLTKEIVFRISGRADDLARALLDGKVVDIQANGTGKIRNAAPEEESEMDPEQFPYHAKSKTVLDI